ncbi:amino acid permease [Rhodococcus ruber]|uniref:amino acid permease n=1 Tax=Rhodococcus ruber TaxID=1830 RepID=UPI0031B7F7AA
MPPASRRSCSAPGWRTSTPGSTSVAPLGSRATTGGALAGLTTVVMVLMLDQTRVLFAMARDGLVPRRLSHTGRHGTPVRTTVPVTVGVAALAGFVPLGALEETVDIGTLFAFVLVSIGVILYFAYSRRHSVLAEPAVPRR